MLENGREKRTSSSFQLLTVKGTRGGGGCLSVGGRHMSIAKVPPHQTVGGSVALVVLEMFCR